MLLFRWLRQRVHLNLLNRCQWASIQSSCVSVFRSHRGSGLDSLVAACVNGLNYNDSDQYLLRQCSRYIARELEDVASPAPVVPVFGTSCPVAGVPIFLHLEWTTNRCEIKCAKSATAGFRRPIRISADRRASRAALLPDLPREGIRQGRQEPSAAGEGDRRARTGDVLVLAEWDRATRSMLDGVHIIERIHARAALLKVL